LATCSLLERNEGVIAVGPGAENAALGLADPPVVDAGLTAGHQAGLIELPQFVAVAAPPLAVAVMAFVLEPDGDAVGLERPQFLAQGVVQLPFPLGGQELNDLLAPGDEAVAVPPHRVLGVSHRDRL